jgi:hypothetical protein
MIELVGRLRPERGDRLSGPFRVELFDEGDSSALAKDAAKRSTAIEYQRSSKLNGTPSAMAPKALNTGGLTP